MEPPGEGKLPLIFLGTELIFGLCNRQTIVLSPRYKLEIDFGHIQTIEFFP